MKRFSLRMLLVVITVVAVFLGYAQWRRRELLNTYNSITHQGVAVEVPNAWHDVVWQRRATNAFMYVPPITYSFKRIRNPQLRKQLEEMGIKLVQAVK